jgi:hypothetical protein
LSLPLGELFFPNSFPWSDPLCGSVLRLQDAVRLHKAEALFPHVMLHFFIAHDRGDQCTLSSIVISMVWQRVSITNRHSPFTNKQFLLERSNTITLSQRHWVRLPICWRHAGLKALPFSLSLSLSRGGRQPSLASLDM